MKKILALALAALPMLLPAQTIWVISNSGPSPDTLKVAFDKANSNFTAIAAITGALPDAQTNSILRGGRYPAWTTNQFLTTNTVLRALPGTFTNVAGMTYTVLTGQTTPSISLSGRIYGGGQDSRRGDFRGL